jgi:hypothetical protein
MGLVIILFLFFIFFACYYSTRNKILSIKIYDKKKEIQNYPDFSIIRFELGFYCWSYLEAFIDHPKFFHDCIQKAYDCTPGCRNQILLKEIFKMNKIFQELQKVEPALQKVETEGKAN